MWSQDESKTIVTNIPEVKPVSVKLEVANIDGDGMTFAAAEYLLSQIGSNVRRGKLALKFWKTDNEVLDHQAERFTDDQSSKHTVDDTVLKVDKEELQSSFPLSARETLKAALVHFGKKWYRRISFIWRHLIQIVDCFSKLWVSRSESQFFFLNFF